MDKPDWRVHVPSLLQETINNAGAGALKIPFTIFAELLGRVAKRASELNDPELNALMVRLTLYDIADPYSKGYDPERAKQVLNQS